MLRVVKSMPFYAQAKALYVYLRRIIRDSKLYVSLKEHSVVEEENRRLLEEACTRFKNDNPQHGSIEDYQACLDKYRVNYSEYMYQYEFWKLSDDQRSEFVSRAEMQAVYRRYLVKWKIAELMTNKVLFLQKYADFVIREWMLVKEHSFEEFKAFVSRFDCIAKPVGSSLGRGVFLIVRGG